MTPLPYSLTQREDGIYVARFANHQKSTLEIHFKHLLQLYKDYPRGKPVYMLINCSHDKLPSIKYVVRQLQDLYSKVSVPEPLYVAYVYPRNDAIQHMFIMMLDALHLHVPRRFFKTEAAAIAWLLEQKSRQDTIDLTDR